MASKPIVSWFVDLKQALSGDDAGHQRPDLHTLSQDSAALPGFVQESPVAMRYLELLGPLAWGRFPERNLVWQPAPVPYAPFVAACLVKLDQQLGSMGHLRQYLVEHPALTWALGFPLAASGASSCGFEVDISLPTQRHFTRLLRTMPNEILQFLLGSSVNLLQAELSSIPVIDTTFGECVSMDTKHILAWVKENNPKAYVSRDQRYDKTRQPPGDPDCRLGCKKKSNQHRGKQVAQEQTPPTPREDPVAGSTARLNEFYWGYASGVVAARIPGWGEFVLAELTQPFNQPDVSYFYPLLQAAERRLGFRPKYGAFDAAFDAHYIYAYFHSEEHDGFAAVPLAARGKKRTFDQNGLPLCQAGLPMPLKGAFISRATLFEHQRGRYVCPLLFPEANGQACRIDHQRWPKGGCVTTMPTSIGARIRYQLDRDSETYKSVYKQRTATERINAQAKALGIERPKFRNGRAIANLNTLIYVLINLRALQRLRQHAAELASPAVLPTESA